MYEWYQSEKRQQTVKDGMQSVRVFKEIKGGREK